MLQPLAQARARMQRSDHVTASATVEPASRRDGPGLAPLHRLDGRALTLAGVFVAWYRSEGTLSIHSIFTRRRELFYWATVMATFALGTAAGDMTAKTLGLGWFAFGRDVAALIAVPAIGYRWLGLNSIVAFWFAYIVTRSLGASFADWLGLPPSLGGVGLGRGVVSLGLTALIVGCVAYLAAAEKRRGAPSPG